MSSETYVFHCPGDFKELKKINSKIATNKQTGETIVFPMFECPSCGKKYTSISSHGHMSKIRFGNELYTNLRCDKDELESSQRKSPQELKTGTQCYVYEKQEPPKECRKCGCKRLVNETYTVLTKKQKRMQVYPLECPQCGMKHINYYSYSAFPKYWTVLNPHELSAIKYIIANKLSKKEYKKKKGQDGRKEAKRLEMQRSAIERAERRQSEMQAYLKRLEDARNISALRAEQARQIGLTAQSSKTEKQINTVEKKIGAKDFVVRRTTFKCRYNGHQLQNVVGCVDIIDQKGDLRPTNVTAGYCPECNLYFIMESVYQNLKTKGIPMCRVSNEKAYLNNKAFINEMLLAEESILKQYGYSVSQEDGLTSLVRRKILAFMIDKHVLTKNEIISYMDFFINQRKNQSKYEKAIEKWESDREFVEEYRQGEYQRYGVRGIYRKY